MYHLGDLPIFTCSMSRTSA